MKLFVGVTDNDWFRFLSQQADVDEVNFWQPGGRTRFRALQPGELFLFKLKRPHNHIAGGGYFAYSDTMPVSWAWKAFGKKNGAQDYATLHNNLVRLRRRAGIGSTDFRIGCILLAQPFFLPEEEWIPVPDSFSRNIVVGKGFDLSRPDGRDIWDAIQYRLAGRQLEQFLLAREEAEPRYALARTRPGQGIFRSMVASAYNWRCAVTGERVLPALEAAHIRPFAKEGPNVVPNGLLLRADIHNLLDDGYVTVSPDHRFEVSRQVKEDYANGRDYYALHGNTLRLPDNKLEWPSREFVDWHNEHKFKG